MNFDRKLIKALAFSTLGVIPASTASSAVVVATLTTTVLDVQNIDGVSVPGSIPNGADTVIIEITMNNGNDTLVSQTYDWSHMESIRLATNNPDGTTFEIIIPRDALVDGGPSVFAGGSFATNSSGQLNHVPASQNWNTNNDAFFFNQVTVNTGSFWGTTGIEYIISIGSPSAPLFQGWIDNESMLPYAILWIPNGGSFGTAAGDWSIAAVPEPSTAALVLGVLAIGVVAWRRRTGK